METRPTDAAVEANKDATERKEVGKLWKRALIGYRTKTTQAVQRGRVDAQYGSSIGATYSAGYGRNVMRTL
jgi:hypothetical protein